MINRIIDFCVNNKFIVFALVAVACLAGWWSIKNMSLDAIPDLSDTQVIVFSRWDRSPDIIEDQVTYPIVSAMVLILMLLGALPTWPHSRSWGYYPSGGLGLVLVILVVLWLLGMVSSYTMGGFIHVLLVVAVIVLLVRLLQGRRVLG